ncbi:MAG: glyoxalase [Chloroflexi bacterium]|jgi:predicted enzyme related to lactoylglutathione lyase|nr:MAG: glyoxalase [Chloroflexota bacterium]
MGNPVIHFEVVGKDGKRLQQFFGQLFDWKIDANNPMNYGMVDTGGNGAIAGGIGPSPDGAGHVTFYVEVDDPKAYLDKAEKLGGKAVMGPMDVPGGPTIALFADPEGNMVGLVKGM